MKKRTLLLIGILFLTGCSTGLGLLSSSPAPSPMPLQQTTPSSAAAVTFIANPPAGTAPGVRIALDVIDELSAGDDASRRFIMQRTPQGQYQVELTPAMGAILSYRYVRIDPDEAPESTPAGKPAFRRAAITGSVTLEDTIAGWEDAPYNGGTGRITGIVLENGSDLPLNEIILYAGGQMTFTDSQGSFQINNLQPGYHRLTLISPTGAHHSTQQGAYVDVDSATPTTFSMQPAQPVQVAFQVTVPDDTLPGSTLRLMGNTLQLGYRFDNEGIAVNDLPQLVMVDATHYILVTTLYSGMDLHYKYTLGDGTWNTERDPSGNPVTRQLIIPDDNLVLEDAVSTWHGDNQATLRFRLLVPGDTPEDDHMTIQFNPDSGTSPIPMWRLGENEWYYILYAPLDPGSDLAYRYCRNARCGSADDSRTAGMNAAPRLVAVESRPQDIEDRVDLWQWWGLAGETSTVVAPEIAPRTDMQVGVALIPGDQRTGAWSGESLLSQLSFLSANHILLTPGWQVVPGNGTPLFAFRPSAGPYEDELQALVRYLHEDGIAVSVQPQLLVGHGNPAEWWATAARDRAWWQVWFEQYEGFILHQAAMAEELSVERFVMGGAFLSPALPSGSLSNGSPSLVPADAAARWEALIGAVRERFSGTLAFELDFTGEVDVPSFLMLVDEVQLYWHAPLVDDGETTTADLQARAGSYLDRLQASPILRARPTTLVVEYLSINGSAAACASAPDGSCRPAEQFDRGAAVDADLDVNLAEQAQAINAVLLAVLPEDSIHGFFVARYDPGAALQDKSASVHGKPASDVLWYWYPRLAP